MVPALAPASPRVAGHQLVGASTGYMTDDRGDWSILMARAAAASTLAVELSALSEPELAGLADALDARHELPFLFISVHAPTKARRLSDADLVAALEPLTPHVDAIVVHPDVLGDVAAYRALGAALAVENMDRRKTAGQTATQLARLFEQLPEAGLCFDLPHAASVDPTLVMAHEILDDHGTRLRHVHLSSLDDAGHHLPLTEADEQRFAPLLDRCRDVPWILEAPPDR